MRRQIRTHSSPALPTKAIRWLMQQHRIILRTGRHPGRAVRHYAHPRKIRAARWIREAGGMPSKRSTFEQQQSFLHRQSAAIAVQAPIAADHAMTREDDRNRIRTEGAPHRARSARLADFTRDPGVCARLAKRNLADGLQHGALKRSHRRPIEWQLKRAAMSLRVLA